MTPRQHTILNSVVETHIETAMPVGSQVVLRRSRLSASPATVRNDMGALEDLGYLEQPHTSSGRVPTDRGYRYYVDHSLTRESIAGSVFAQIHDRLSSLPMETEDPEFFLEEVSRFIAHAAQETSMILLSDAQASRLRKSRVKLFLQGSTHLLEKPEFQNIDKVRSLFRAFEQKIELIDWLTSQSADKDKAVVVKIGHENPSEVFHECAVIATRYYSCGEEAGTLAVIGPRRMKYRQTVPLVSCVAELISSTLDERFLD